MGTWAFRSFRGFWPDPLWVDYKPPRNQPMAPCIRKFDFPLVLFSFLKFFAPPQVLFLGGGANCFFFGGVFASFFLSVVIFFRPFFLCVFPCQQNGYRLTRFWLRSPCSAPSLMLFQLPPTVFVTGHPSSTMRCGGF